LELGEPRHVCRLVPLRRQFYLNTEEWRLVYEGYRDQVEISLASKDIVFLHPAPQEEGHNFFGTPRLMSSIQTIAIHAVHDFLYHDRFSKLHSSLALLYPLVVALPSLFPPPERYTVSLINALMYSNGLASSEALQQPYYVESITGISWQTLGLRMEEIGQGLQSVRGRLQLRFPGEYFVFRIFPAVGALPLQVRVS
jgi:hypothetical protein